MSETCYNVPPDRDVIVLDQGTPSATAAALIAAAVAAGLPERVVRYQAETGGFVVPASIANTEVPPEPEPVTMPWWGAGTNAVMVRFPNSFQDADWGDGTPLDSINSTIDSHVYAVAGTYTVTATSTNDGTVTVQEVVAGPVGPYDPVGTFTHFMGDGNTAVWTITPMPDVAFIDPGNGDPATSTTSHYDYSTPGTFTATVWGWETGYNGDTDPTLVVHGTTVVTIA